jgi:hypothetical protein
MQKPVPPANPSSLSQAQQLAWLHQDPAPATSREALGRTQETLRQCLAAFDSDQVAAAQSALEDVMIQVLISMRTLGLHPDQALRRALGRLRQPAGQRAFHIFPDRVEIRAQGQPRGEWPLFSQGDYESALKLARELDCDVVHEEACQLELFHRARIQDAGYPAQ